LRDCATSEFFQRGCVNKLSGCARDFGSNSIVIRNVIVKCALGVRVTGAGARRDA
jgi:hypothetical protein